MGKVMGWVYATHRLWLVIFSFFLLGVTAWADVRLSGNVEIDSTAKLPSFRQASRQALDEQGKPLDTYAVTPADILEFFAIAPPAPPKRVSLLVGDCPADCTSICKVTKGRALAVERGRPRVAAGALSLIGAIDIAVTGEVPSKTELCSGPSNAPTQFFPDRGSKKWKEVRDKLKGKKYDLTLLPRAQRRVFPGDLIKVSIAYQYSAGQYTGSEPFTLAQTTARVDRAGRVYLPGLSSPGPIEDPNTNQINDIVRQNAVPAAFSVAVWAPGQSYNDQPTLDEIERCLLIARDGGPGPTGTPRLLEQEKRCQELGIDSVTYGEKPVNNMRLVYWLEAEQTYSVTIGEIGDDLRVERQFLPGQTVTSGVRDVLRHYLGRELSFRHKHYITVVPRAELDVGANKPFFALVTDGTSILDGVLIAPGDSLILTDSKPSKP